MRKNLKALLLLVVMIAISMPIKAVGTFVNYNSDGFVWIANGKALPILVDEQEDKGVMRAVNNLLSDANAVTGITPQLIYTPNGQQALIIGTIESQWIKQLIANGKIDGNELKGKREKYVLQTIDNPLEGIEKVIN